VRLDDHVAEIDADAEPEPLLLRHLRLALGHAGHFDVLRHDGVKKGRDSPSFRLKERAIDDFTVERVLFCTNPDPRHRHFDVLRHDGVKI
jgi:hypothetical protein